MKQASQHLQGSSAQRRRQAGKSVPPVPWKAGCPASSPFWWLQGAHAQPYSQGALVLRRLQAAILFVGQEQDSQLYQRQTT